MKVFYCKNQRSFGGGLVLVAANTKEEAYLMAAMNDNISYLFDWHDDEYTRCEPDGNINHCKSDTYPLDKWREVEHLSTNLTEPQVIIEDHYFE